MLFSSVQNLTHPSGQSKSVKSSTMSLQYDNIGADYTPAKELPYSLLELAAFKSHIGDVNQRRVLDLACGTGYFSRKLIEWGADEVVGLDISKTMVDEARRHNEGKTERLRFHVADCSKPIETLGLGRFDLVIAVWLLHYIATEEGVLTFWQNVSNSLKPGGRCIGIAPNHESLTKGFAEGERFGLTFKELEPIERGVKFQCTIHIANPVTIENCYLREREVLETLATEAGLSLRWMPYVNPNIPGLDYEKFLRLPHFKIFECVALKSSVPA